MSVCYYARGRALEESHTWSVLLHDLVDGGSFNVVDDVVARTGN